MSAQLLKEKKKSVQKISISSSLRSGQLFTSLTSWSLPSSFPLTAFSHGSAVHAPTELFFQWLWRSLHPSWSPILQTNWASRFSMVVPGLHSSAPMLIAAIATLGLLVFIVLFCEHRQLPNDSSPLDCHLCFLLIPFSPFLCFKAFLQKKIVCDCGLLPGDPTA